MAGRLEGKVAMVTGAAQGLGASTVRRFVEEGAHVLASDVLVDMGRQSIEGLSNVAFVELDVTNEQQWGDAYDECVRRFGAPDVLVNNAAMVRTNKIHEEDLSGWNQVLAVNVTGAFLGMKTVLPQMMERRAGSIVNIASIWGMVGAGSSAAYQASKGAITLLTKNGAISYAEYGIRVNSVHPGGMKTALIDAAEAEEAVAAATPFGRVGRADELADIVVYLASDEASFATGAEFVIDGGYTAQ